jgi:hypothetical protein
MLSLPVLLATAVSFLAAGSVFFWTRSDDHSST